MKKLAALIAAGLLILSMIGCSSTCKKDGCEERAEQNGYCGVHYAEHEIEKILGTLQ